jgi:hypothetical protein
MVCMYVEVNALPEKQPFFRSWKKKKDTKPDEKGDFKFIWLHPIGTTLLRPSNRAADEWMAGVLAEQDRRRRKRVGWRRRWGVVTILILINDCCDDNASQLYGD